MLDKAMDKQTKNAWVQYNEDEAEFPVPDMSDKNVM